MEMDEKCDLMRNVDSVAYFKSQGGVEITDILLIIYFFYFIYVRNWIDFWES